MRFLIIFSKKTNMYYINNKLTKTKRCDTQNDYYCTSRFIHKTGYIDEE